MMAAEAAIEWNTLLFALEYIACVIHRLNLSSSSSSSSPFTFKAIKLCESICEVEALKSKLSS